MHSSMSVTMTCGHALFSAHARPPTAWHEANEQHHLLQEALASENRRMCAHARLGKADTPAPSSRHRLPHKRSLLKAAELWMRGLSVHQAAGLCVTRRLGCVPDILGQQDASLPDSATDAHAPLLLHCQLQLVGQLHAAIPDTAFLLAL